MMKVDEADHENQALRQSVEQKFTSLCLLQEQLMKKVNEADHENQALRYSVEQNSTLLHSVCRSN